MANPFEATRYHSLIVKEDTLPKFLRAVSHTEDQKEFSVSVVALELKS